MQNSEFSSLQESAKDLGKFTFEIVKRAIANGGASLTVSRKVQKGRLDTCRECEKYDEMQHMCIECGCNLGMKTKFSLETCPLMKWKESDEDWMNGEYAHILKNLHREMPRNIPNEPQFPDRKKYNLKVGDIYEWNFREWRWDGRNWVSLTK